MAGKIVEFFKKFVSPLGVIEKDSGGGASELQPMARSQGPEPIPVAENYHTPVVEEKPVEPRFQQENSEMIPILGQNIDLSHLFVHPSDEMVLRSNEDDFNEIGSSELTHVPKEPGNPEWEGNWI